MPDPLESMLDRLGTVATEPPAAFIHAVARRRHRRRLNQAAAMACVGLVVAVAWLMLQPGTVPGAQRVVGVPPPPTSMLALRRVNASLDADALTLPELPESGGDDGGSMGIRSEWLER